jgi:type IV secretion system protein TrbD
MNSSMPPGWEAPFHRSLTQPVLRAGLPQGLAVPLWLTVAASVFVLSQLWLLPVGVLAHAACAALTRYDPHFFNVLPLALWAQRRLDP